MKKFDYNGKRITVFINKFKLSSFFTPFDVMSMCVAMNNTRNIRRYRCWKQLKNYEQSFISHFNIYFKEKKINRKLPITHVWDLSFDFTVIEVVSTTNEILGLIVNHSYDKELLENEIFSLTEEMVKENLISEDSRQSNLDMFCISKKIIDKPMTEYDKDLHRYGNQP